MREDEEATIRTLKTYRSAVKATTYQALGRGEEAKAVVEEVLRINPTYCLEDWRKRMLGQIRDQSAVDRILSYARQAGLPEKSPQGGAEVR